MPRAHGRVTVDGRAEREQAGGGGPVAGNPLCDGEQATVARLGPEGLRGLPGKQHRAPAAVGSLGPGSLEQITNAFFDVGGQYRRNV